MKRLFLAIFFISLLVIVNAVNEDLIYSAEEVTSKVEITSSLILSNTDSSYSVAFVSANLSFVPIETETQKITSINYNPEPNKKGEGYLFFKWDNPEIAEYTYRIEADIISKINRKKIVEMVKFPITNLDEEYIIYTLPTDNIDSNEPEIVAIASSLAEGEDDLYIVVNNLVSWIKDNIEYSLDTLTAEVSQPASWVIKNRYGVCDEITSLFIAMARSLGIPVRFSSGMAYTNWNDLNDWGPHAWAEVYFPEIGWVSYDITYNEFGYVDAAHIKLKDSLDSNEASTNYEWKGRNVDLEPDKLDVKVSLIGKTGRLDPQISINTIPFKAETGFGSYNVIEAVVQNLQDYYVSEDLTLTKVKEMEILSNLDRQIVLKPRESKRLFWLVKISNNLDSRYIYTLPASVYSSRNVTGSSSITSNNKGKIYSKEEIESYINEEIEEDTKKYSKDISLTCQSDDSLFLGDTLEIKCTISNLGNVYIKDLGVCQLKECEVFDLGISKTKETSYSLVMGEIGESDYTVKATNTQVSKSEHITVIVFDKPNIEISSLEYQSRVQFGETFKLKFILNKTSLSIPLNTKVILSRGRVANNWEIGELTDTQEFIVNFETKELSRENIFDIQVIYEDDVGTSFIDEEQIIVEVYSEGLLNALKMWLNKMVSFFR